MRRFLHMNLFGILFGIISGLMGIPWYKEAPLFGIAIVMMVTRPEEKGQR